MFNLNNICCFPLLFSLFPTNNRIMFKNEKSKAEILLKNGKLFEKT